MRYLLRGEVRSGKFAKRIDTWVTMIKEMKDPKTNVKNRGRREFVLKF